MKVTNEEEKVDFYKRYLSKFYCCKDFESGEKNIDFT